MKNLVERATAITVLTPINREGPLVLWAVFWAGRHIKETLLKLQQLSFIHYARWVVIDRFPDEGHGFAKPENQIKFYAAAERFLARYLGGRFEE